jgi:hypothetical protein
LRGFEFFNAHDQSSRSSKSSAEMSTARPAARAAAVWW